MSQEKVRCRQCARFGDDKVPPKLWNDGFGRCKLATERAGSHALGKATYKSAEFSRVCGDFSPVPA